MNFANGQHVDTSDVISLCDDMFQVIDMVPDVIIGIAEGGIMPAKILADKFNCTITYMPIKRKYSRLKHNIFVRAFAKYIDKYYQKYHTIRRMTEILNKSSSRNIPANSNGTKYNATTKILIVDDFASSGHTLDMCRRYLLQNGAEYDNIKSAVLIYDINKYEVQSKPDYYLNNTIWLCFPWSSNSPHYNDYLKWKILNQVK